MKHKILTVLVASLVIVAVVSFGASSIEGEGWWVEDNSASLPTLADAGWRVIGYDVSTEASFSGGYITRFRYLLEHPEELGNYMCSEVFSVVNYDDPVSQACARLR